MRKLILLLGLLASLPAVSFAQVGATTPLRSGATLPAVCAPGTASGGAFFKTTAPIGTHQCVASNTWLYILGAATSSIVGQLLRVTGAGTFGFGPLDLADADSITGDIPDVNLSANVSLSANLPINVKAPPYSCVGDGVADDTTCTNAAFAAAISETRGLYFPAGTYLTNLVVATNFFGLDIYGDGEQASFIKSKTGGTTLSITGTSSHSYHIHDLGIYGTGSAVGLSISGCTLAAAAECTTTVAHGRSTGDYIAIKGATGTGWTAINGYWKLTSTGASTFTIPINSTGFGTLGGTITGGYGHGVYIDAAANDAFAVVINNVYIAETGAAGLYCKDCIYARLEHAFVSDTGGHGIDVESMQLINNVYIGELPTPGTAGFRIHSGRVVFFASTGITTSTLADWAVLGDNVAEDGQDEYVFATFIGSNIEDFTRHGVRLKGGNTFASFYNTSFLAPASGSVVAFLVDSQTDNGQASVFSADSSILTKGATWLNSNPIHSSGAAPFTSYNSQITTYYRDDQASVYTMPYLGATLITSGVSSLFTPDLWIEDRLRFGTGATLDISAGLSFRLPTSATPETDLSGELALDSTITDHQPLPQYFDGGENMTVIAVDTAELPATDGEIIKYDAAIDKFVFAAGAPAWGSITGTLTDQTDLVTALDAKVETAGDGLTKTGTDVDCDTSSATVSGCTEHAIASEVDGGAALDRSITPDALAGSTIFGRKTAQIEIFADATALTTGDGKFYWPVPDEWAGMNIVAVSAHLGAVVSSSGAVTVDLTNCPAVATGIRCSGSNTDILSTNLTIDANEDGSETAAAAVIDATNDAVPAAGHIRIDVDAIGTSTQGLIVRIVGQLP